MCARNNGTLVAAEFSCEAFAHLGPLSISHLGQLPAATISFNLAPGIALGDAITQVNAAMLDLKRRNADRQLSGAAQVFQSSLAGMGHAAVMAIFVIYLVLGILYESYIPSDHHSVGAAYRGHGHTRHADVVRACHSICMPTSALSCWWASSKNALHDD